MQDGTVPLKLTSLRKTDASIQTIFPFFRLPLELRQQVYSYFYASLTLTYPNLACGSLTDVSHQVCEESMPAYYKNVHFSFLNTKHLVDYLANIDSTTLPKLRHISVRGHPFAVYDIDDRAYTAQFFSAVLALFPGLQLSTLTVRDSCHEPGAICDLWGHEASYTDVEELIMSDGFKNLIYVSTSDRFMKLAVEAQGNESEVSRHPQPSTWDDTVKSRDGADSGAEVTMYRVTGEGCVKVKDEFETVQHLQRRDQESQPPRPIAIHWKRGRGMDYVQSCQKAQDFDKPLRKPFKRVRWKVCLESGLCLEVSNQDPPAHLEDHQPSLVGRKE